MDYSLLKTWLINSMWGVIILGAIGSIVATCLLKLVKHTFHFFNFSRYKYKRREYDKGVKGGLVLGYIETKKDTNFALIYLAFRLIRFILSCTCLVVIILTLFYFTINKDSQILTTFSLLFSILFFLNLRWIYEEYREFYLPYKKHVLPKIEDMCDSFYKDLVKKEQSNSVEEKDNS